MYEYKQLNSKKVEDIEAHANQQARQGWELMQVLACQDRYVSVFRKPKS